MLQILSKNCLHTLRRAHFTSPVSFISIWPLKVCHFALYKQKGLMGHPVFSTLSSLAVSCFAVRYLEEEDEKWKG